MERRLNLSHRIAEVLGRSIVSGELARDKPVPTEAELGRRFEVSRTAVREAVKMLAAKGLLTSKPRQGIRILPEDSWNIFDPDLLAWSLSVRPTKLVLREFFQMRVGIEPEAASLAADHPVPERIPAVGEALEQMRAARPGTPAALEADIRFHEAVLHATGNRYYLRMRDFVRTALSVSIGLTTRPDDDYVATVRAHAAVATAIARQEPDVARRRMRELIEAASVHLTG